jgi:hypothetical protein
MAKVGAGAIPKTTTSMVKFVRTGEGMLVVAFNIALLIVPIISSALTPAQAVKWAAVINGVAVVARTGLKMTALVQSGGTAAALEPAPRVDPGSLEDATTAASADAGRIDDAVSDADEFASLPSVANVNNNMTPMGAP